MIEFTKLELRKDRDLFAGMAGIFLASLPLVSLIARMNHYSVLHALNATLLFWTVVGLPFIAVFFGAYGGSALRHEPWLSAEEPLPVSPLERVGAAVLAEASYLVLMILLVWATTSLLSYDFRSSLATRDFAREVFLPYLYVESFAMAYGFLLAFVLAYLVGHAFAGGALGVVLVGTVTGSLTRSFADHLIYGPRSPLWPSVVFVCVVCLVGALQCLRWAAAWLERSENRGWSQGLKLAGLLVATTFVSLVTGNVVEKETARSLQLVAQVHYWIPWRSEIRAARQEPGDSTVLLEAVDGTLAWVSPDKGAVVATPRHGHTAHQILGRTFAYEIKGLARDGQGRVWVMRKADSPGKWEVLSGSPGRRLELKATFPVPGKFDVWLSVIGNCVLVETKDSIKFPARFAEIGGSAPLAWKPREQVCRGAWDPAAVLDESGTVLTQKKPDGSRRIWKLPGRYSFHMMKKPWVMAPTMFGGRRAYLVPLERSQKRHALAVCGEDGSVRLEWERPYQWAWGPSFAVAPDGTVSDWFWEGSRRRLLLATKDGRFLPPIAVEEDPSLKDGNEPSVVHEQAGHAWLLYNDRLLVETDLTTGKPVHSWRLPDPQPMRDHYLTPVQAVDQGLFVRTPGALYFYDWQGQRRTIRL